VTVSFPLYSTSAFDLVNLAWDLTCSAGIVVKIDDVTTERGNERCVSARCVAGEHAFMLVPRSEKYIEVWWGEYDEQPHLIGMATGVEGIVALARRTLSADAAPVAPIDVTA
jgi:hypothetical protein